MRTILDIPVADKVCLTRVDLNCPLNESKEIMDYTRIKAHAETIKFLADKEAKVVVIAHQGRPGSTDFSSLVEHTEKLELILSSDYNIDFLPITHGLKVEQRINELKNGDILVLENVRELKEEPLNKSPQEHAKSDYIKSLSKVGDIFVNDAFSAAHRSHMSLVGFTWVIPSVAGLIMTREITNLQRVVDNPKRPCTFILGGVKPEDSFKVAYYVLSNDIADNVLTGGVISEVLLLAKGLKLGEPSMRFLESKDLLRFISPANELINKFKDRVKAQIDFAVDENGRTNFKMDDLPLSSAILDIGDETIKLYRKIIQNSSTCVFNGPMGKFEDPGFKKGTVEVFESMAGSKGFSLAGGGHSISILEKENIKLSYVSTAGGAMIRFLMGKTLPAIEALEMNSKKFEFEK
jgi:phosphoglycerate kinase